MNRSGDDASDRDNRRREPRSSPYFYQPHVVVSPDSPDNRIRGFIRNESRKGFSAQFNLAFPYSVGDILDVRVGYQRAWAEVVWIEQLQDELFVVGFRLHPEDFLDQFQT